MCKKMHGVFVFFGETTTILFLSLQQLIKTIVMIIIKTILKVIITPMTVFKTALMIMITQKKLC